MKHWLGILLVCLLVSQPAFSEELKASVGADILLETMAWTEGELPPDDQAIRALGSAKLPTSLRYTRRYRFRALPSVQWDPQNVSESERFFWDFQEAYFQYQNLPFTLQLGWNVVTWGQTDIFNPLDVVNARRYFDPFRAEKLGSFMLLLKRDFENFFAEAIYIPKQRRTDLPGENSRWLPREVYRSRSLEGYRVLVPANTRYHYLSPLEFQDSLDHNIGLRLKFRFSDLDFTLAGFDGGATTPLVDVPVLNLNVVGVQNGIYTVQFDPDVNLRAYYYRSRMLGGSFTWLPPWLMVKGALAYTESRSNKTDAPNREWVPELPPRTWEAVLGLERSLSIGSGVTTILLQGTYVDRGDNLDTNSVSLARMFDRAAMIGLRWAPSERLSMIGSYLRDVRFEGDLFHLEGSYKIADGWSAKLAGDLLEGSMETPIGTYRRNDRVTAGLSIQY